MSELEGAETDETEESGESYLIVFEADADERERVEGLAEALGVPVWAAGPEELTPGRSDTWDSLVRSRAVIVSPDIGPHRGLDLIEALAWDAGSAHIPTALCLPEAKARWIHAAIAAGASTCLQHPLDPAEVQSKLLANGTSEPQTADGDGAEGDGARGDEGGE